MKKQRILADFFLFYPHKQNIKCPIGTVPYPYVKKSEISNHPDAIDYNLYRSIIERYLELKGDDIVNGIDYEAKGRIGYIGFKKFKFTKNGYVNYLKSQRAKKTVKDFNRGADKYAVKSAWERYRRSPINRVAWRIKLNNNLYRRVYEQCDLDYTHIYKFKNA